MSKIITKKSLNTLIESTIKEYSNILLEAENEIKLTKQHMDELHKQGYCMHDDKCLVYYEDIKGDDKKMAELMSKLSSEEMDCVVITKQQMDMLHKDGKCDCDDNVTLSYSEEMDDHMSENEGTCPTCGSAVCECGSMSYMGDTGVDEGNEFTGELDKAREKGNPTFTVDGKTYKVEPIEEPVEESTKDLAESVNKTFNSSLLTEDMDNFKKLINYRNK